ncbi:MAG: type IV pilus assembly protein PilM [Verrucomicrobia bacterium]|nr:type IV pilus assembly protein PilM [Verrucomicrobiota bacterium]
MLNSKSFLGVDFGAGSLKVAEFELDEGGNLVLKQYGIRPLGLEGSQETARENVLRKAIQELFSERGFGSKKTNVCAPGFHVFSKFVKLPPVDTSKVTQIIQYEAQQNVPFPLEEVVWDYQILGSTPTGELEVLLVAIKSDIVEGLFRTAEATGLRLQLVEVSPAALCNAFRYNYGDLEGCTMLLDIGAKTSNLLFFEKGKVYSRSINIGANSITQEFGAESKLRFPEAEKVKIAEGFVSLGGAYEEPENPHQAAISKIARQVMTRLHIQVNQTIQFYRGQQGGSAPLRLFLAGGASIMPYTAQFFAEKLNVPVEYFNPFRNIQINPAINLEELARVAHAFGEVVGLGLRNAAQCPVELNLVPKSIRKRQQFDQKKPYFIAAIFSLVLVVFAYGWFYDRVAAVKQASLAEIMQELEPLKQKETLLVGQEQAIKKTKDELEAFGGYLQQRFYWPDLLKEVRDTLMATERTLSRPGLDVGIWIERFATNAPGADLNSTQTTEEAAPQYSIFRMDPKLLERYGLIRPGMLRTPESTESTETPAEDAVDPVTGMPVEKKDTNQVGIVYATFRAVDLTRAGPSANGDLIYAIETALQANSLLDKEGTKLHGEKTDVDPDTSTFTFGMTLKVKQPIKD